MKIMTFNLRSDSVLDGKNRWRHRKEIVCDILEKYSCDIIGLQEVTVKMRADLEKNLKGYQIIGRPRSKRFFIEHNNILVSTKHTILSQETFWLSRNPQKVGSSVWYSIFPRICTTAKIKLSTGAVVRVYNTHLDCYLSPARQYGLKKIMRYIEKQHALEKLPVILMGDFNANPHHRVIQTIFGEKYNTQQLVAVQEKDPKIYHQATMGRFKDRERGMHLDYIFVSPEYEVERTQIIKDNQNGRFPSDHYPLVADICLQRGNG